MIIEIIVVLLVVLAALFFWFRRKKGALSAPKEIVLPQQPGGLGLSLSKTRNVIEGRLRRLTSTDAVWTGIEEALLEADVGLSMTKELIEAVRKKTNGSPGIKAIQQALSDEAVRIFEAVPGGVESPVPKPKVISVIGVNGVGKTTTIGKLSSLMNREGKSVLIGAADTFRAAAVDQIRVWAERSQADFVSGREGADPGSVVFDALTAGVARGKDVVIIDTAGRLHTKTNLVEELKKIHRVMKKVLPEAPHEILLVVDGTLGQNSVQQARQFGKELGITGVVVTKLDGTAKGGAVLTIASELAIPIRYMGIGESVDDLIPFNAKNFVEALIGQA